MLVRAFKMFLLILLQKDLLLEMVSRTHWTLTDLLAQL